MNWRKVLSWAINVDRPLSKNDKYFGVNKYYISSVVGSPHNLVVVPHNIEDDSTLELVTTSDKDIIMITYITEPGDNTFYGGVGNTHEYDSVELSEIPQLIADAEGTFKDIGTGFRPHGNSDNIMQYIILDLKNRRTIYDSNPGEIRVQYRIE